MKILFATLILLVGVAAHADNVKQQDWNVTDGHLTRTADNHLMVDAKEFRATLTYPTQQHVTVHFKYLGPTNSVSYLQNGELRHQLGIKMRAQDICNLGYAMWNFDLQKIVVSVKKNPGLRTSEECKDSGYHFDMKPGTVKAPNSVRPNEWHTLTVELIDKHLKVIADSDLVWEGEMLEDVRNIDGPVGIRSDNVRVLFDYNVER